MNKISGLFRIAFTLLFIQTALAQQNSLTIKLPYETTVADENVTLGSIAQIKGDEEPVKQAAAIGLGRIIVPEQTLTIDRSMILSRLKCTDGLSHCIPEFSGADKVRVSRASLTIKGESFVESGRSFLAKSIKSDSIAKWEPARTPADVVLAGEQKDIELAPRLVSRNTTGTVNLEISVITDGAAVASRQVIFRPKYDVSQAVTTTDVKKGTALDSNNIKIEQTLSDKPQQVDWTQAEGLVATRDLASGTVLNISMAKPPRPKVAIARNQTVVIKIDNAGLTVTAMGVAIQQGSVGECIKVRNIDSQRIIATKINEDGTVEPVL